MSETRTKARPVVISGYSSQPLAKSIAEEMGTRFVDVRYKQHTDREIEPTILGNVRGSDVILVASAAGDPNKQMFETQLLLDSLRRADARTISLVLPYMWYGRSDSNFAERKSPALTRVIKNLKDDCNRVIVADPHNAVLTREVFEAFGKNCIVVPFALPYAQQLRTLFNAAALEPAKTLFLHPDAGSVKRIDTTFRDALYHTLEINENPNSDSWPQIGKDRNKQTNESKTKDITVSVEGMDVVIFEDMIASAKTACDLATSLKKAGARTVTFFASNGLFTPKEGERKTASVDRINNSEIDYVFVTNTYDHSLTSVKINGAIKKSPKIHVIDVSPYLSSILNALHMEVFEDTPEDANSISAIMRGRHPDQEKWERVTPLKRQLTPQVG